MPTSDTLVRWSSGRSLPTASVPAMPPVSSSLGPSPSGFDSPSLAPALGLRNLGFRNPVRAYFSGYPTRLGSSRGPESSRQFAKTSFTNAEQPLSVSRLLLNLEEAFSPRCCWVVFDPGAAGSCRAAGKWMPPSTACSGSHTTRYVGGTARTPQLRVKRSQRLSYYPNHSTESSEGSLRYGAANCWNWLNKDEKKQNKTILCRAFYTKDFKVICIMDFILQDICSIYTKPVFLLIEFCSRVQTTKQTVQIDTSRVL